MSDECIPQRVQRWVRTFEADVREGRLSLLELVEIATADALETTPTLCPACARVVRASAPGARLGVCVVCQFERLKLATDAKIREIEAQRGYNQSRTELKRLRQREGLLPEQVRDTYDYRGRARFVRPVGDYDRAGTVATDIPIGTPVQECRACGLTWHSATAEGGLCVECRERAERRRAARAHGDGRDVMSSTGEAGAKPEQPGGTNRTQATPRPGAESGRGRSSGARCERRRAGPEPVHE